MNTGATTNRLPPRACHGGSRRSLLERAAVRPVQRLLLIALGFMLSVVASAQVPSTAQSQAQPMAASAGAKSGAVPGARTGSQRVDAVDAELIADVARAVPGQPFRLGLRLKHDAGWHTYWRNPGDSGLPTRFEPVGPAGASYSAITWPAPQRLAIGGLANYGFEGEIVLSREVTLPVATDVKAARFEVLAQWLVCKDVCIPGEAALALEVPVAAAAVPAAADLRNLFDQNAARAPDPLAAGQAGWWQAGSVAYLMLPAGSAATRAEFFPYFEGVVRPAAPQTLVQMAADAGGTGGAGAAGAIEAQGAAGTRDSGGAGGTRAAGQEAAGSSADAGLANETQSPGGERVADAASAGGPGGAGSVGGAGSLGGAGGAGGASARVGSPSLALRLETVPALPPEGGGAGGPAGSASAPVSTLPEPAAGLLLLDGKPLEVSLRRHLVEPVTGATVSIAEVAPPAPATSGGLLGRLRGPVSQPGAAPVPEGVARAYPASTLGAATQSLWIALAAAFAGGLILNLMPCVFPVIGLKVLSFSQASGGNPRVARLHSLAFSGGVVLSFLVLALMLLGLRSAGEAAGWGFQMQSPVFVGAMALLFVLIALNLSGVFEAGVSLTRLPVGLPIAPASRDTANGGAPGGSQGGGTWHSFGTGALAVLVATPCTAPFMGSAVGYTITSTPLPDAPGFRRARRRDGRTVPGAGFRPGASAPAATTRALAPGLQAAPRLPDAGHGRLAGLGHHAAGGR